MPNPDGRPRMPLDDAAIIGAYLDGESETAIAKRLGVGRTTVHRRLVSAGVKLRSAVAARSLQCHKTFETTDRMLDLIDGLLLGDGTISPHSRSESRLSVEQRSDRRDWLLAVKSAFDTLDVKSSIAIRPPRKATFPNGRHGMSSEQLIWRTGKYATLSAQRDRWYPSGTKRVPEDVRLGPIALAHWYWGDGSTKPRGYGMVFNTIGFEIAEVEDLAARLFDLYGWKVNIIKHRKGRVLQICQRAHRTELLALIEEHCPSCFQYKLEPVRRQLSD